MMMDVNAAGTRARGRGGEQMKGWFFFAGTQVGAVVTLLFLALLIGGGGDEYDERRH